MAVRKTSRLANPDQAVIAGFGDELDYEGGVHVLTTLHETHPLPRPEGVELVLVNTQDTLAYLVDTLRTGDEVATDTEFSGAGRDVNAHRRTMKTTGFSFASGSTAFYVPLRHRNPSMPQLAIDVVRKALNPVLGRPMCGHNLKIDREVYLYEGFNAPSLDIDTMNAAAALGHQRRGLKERFLKDVGGLTIDFNDLVVRCGLSKTNPDPRAFPIEDMFVYAANDAWMTLQLARLYRKQLAEGTALNSLFHRVMMPLDTALMRMEMAGMWEQDSHYAQMVKDFGQEIETLDKKLYNLNRSRPTGKGQKFNVDSAKHLGRFLYDVLQLPVTMTTSKGDRAVNKKALTSLVKAIKENGTDVFDEIGQMDYMAHVKNLVENLGEGYEAAEPKEFVLDVISTIKRRTELKKLRSTYDMRNYALGPVESCPEISRSHPSLYQGRTGTGRLASSNFNAQNIPTRTAEGRRIRDGFVVPAKPHYIDDTGKTRWVDGPITYTIPTSEPTIDRNEIRAGIFVDALRGHWQDETGREVHPGWTLVSADQSQMEPRVLAWVLATVFGDNTLLDSYRQNKDIYFTLGGLAMNLTYEQLAAAAKSSDKKEAAWAKAIRSAAKVLVLALFYGATPEGLVDNDLLAALKPTVETLRDWLESLYDNIPALRSYQFNCACWAIKNGYIESPWGWRRQIPEFLSGDRMERLGAARQGMNAPIQGFNANVICAGIVWMNAILDAMGLGGVIVLCAQVHDEIIARVRNDFLKVAEALFRKGLCTVYDVGAPLKSDVEISYPGPDGWGRWGTLVDIKDFGGYGSGAERELPPQHPQTAQMIEHLDVYKSSYGDMPLSSVMQRFDLSSVSDAAFPLFVWYANALKVPLYDERLPEVGNVPNQWHGLVIGARGIVSHRTGKTYYRGVLACRGQFLPLIAFDDVLKDNTTMRIYGQYEADYGNYRVAEAVPERVVPVSQRLLAEGKPGRIGGRRVRFDLLRDRIQQHQGR